MRMRRLNGLLTQAMAAGSPAGGQPHSGLFRRSMSFATAPELQEYVLQDITPGEHVGDGAYGHVTKLDYNGTPVAGKRLHMILLNAQEGNLRERFVHECRLLKDLRHPHIVQFLGICFLPDSQMPVLVMEFLPYNLHDMLVQHPRIHMSVKLSLLKDVLRGLCYLHIQTPPVIHRDLSARNVLLNSALVAKIADFGVARIIDPQHLSRTLTAVPGAGVYMPPEAAQSTEDAALTYSSKLDIFSFGVLLLFVVTQVFPKDPLPATYMEDNELKPRNELQRRQQYMTTAEEVLGDEEHPLLTVVRECLSNVVDRRPTAAAILERVSELGGGEAEEDLMERDKLQMIVELQRLQAEFEGLQRILYEEDELGVLLAEKERQIVEHEEEQRRLNQSLTAKERELHSVQATVTLKEREKYFLEEQLSRLQAEQRRRESEVQILRDTMQTQAADQNQVMERELRMAQRELQDLRQEKDLWLREQEQLTEQVERKERLLQEKREEVLLAKNEVDRVMGELTEARRTAQSLRSQLDSALTELQGKTAQVAELDELRGVRDELQTAQQETRDTRLENAQLRNMVRFTSRPPPQPLGLQVNLPLTFAPIHSAPYGVNSAKAVMLGNSVVVAGGNADVDNQQQVMYYRPERHSWGALGRYSLSLFAMAVLGGNRLIVLVGGYDLASDTYSNNLVQWDNKGKYWRPIFHPMPTARSDAAAVGYKAYLVVAGGSNGVENLTTVEVLNTLTVEWSTVAPLPVPIEGLVQSVPLVDASRPEADTWYLMGWETGLRQPALTFSLSLTQLTSHLEGGGGMGWAKLPSPPLACAGAVIFKGCLLAVGGKDRHGGKKADIHLYLPGTCEWLKVSELPVAKHSCCCFPLSSEEFMIIGGCEATQFSTRVDIARST